MAAGQECVGKHHVFHCTRWLPSYFLSCSFVVFLLPPLPLPVLKMLGFLSFPPVSSPLRGRFAWEISSSPVALNAIYMLAPVWIGVFSPDLSSELCICTPYCPRDSVSQKHLEHVCPKQNFILGFSPTQLRRLSEQMPQSQSNIVITIFSFLQHDI